MTEKKQTAVDYLQHAIYRIVDLNPEHHRRLNEAIEKAKAMQKEQIMDAFWEGGQWNPKTVSGAEGYYNFVYGEENQEKARRAAQLAEERRMREEPREYKRGDYKERINFYKKMYDDFSEITFIAFAVHPDDLNEAVELAKKNWPDAIVSGVVADFIESGSAVEILFDQTHKDND